jgi:uncharacterized membrane protein YoaK (UPF0700 family)
MHPQLRGWVDVQRTQEANRRLGTTLCFVAGATNAGGFLAVGQYTSHMTGIVSAVADDIAQGHGFMALAGVGALLAFLLGAMSTAWLVNWGLRRHMASAFGLPLLLESGALLVFGLFGAVIDLWIQLVVPLTVLWLCYLMGLQNAVITKISRAEIRTTHLTGLITDLGIELGKLLYINRHPAATPVQANTEKLRLQARLVGAFFLGALGGALGFKHLGYVTTLPLAAMLLLLIWRPLVADLGRSAFRPSERKY